MLKFEVALTAGAITETSTTVGIADSNLYGLSEADINKSLDEMKSIGVTSVRILIPWAFIEPLPGFYDWSKVDMIVAAAEARDMSVLGDITAAPPLWASSPAPLGCYCGAPLDPDQYADFAGTVAGRYAGEIAAYEVWNEQNSFVGWLGPNGGPDAAAYTELLKAAYPVIKNADPDATVIAGGLISVFSAGNLTVDPVTFVNQMYAAGAQGYFDALAFHPYQYTMKFSDGTNIPLSAITQLGQIHQLMVDNGDGSKLIWTTEYGEPSYPGGEANQEDYIVDFLNTWKTLGYAGPAYIYTTRDNNSDSTNPDDTLGIFKTDWTPKQVAQAIEDFIAANPQTPPTDPFGDAVNAFLQQLAQAILTALANALNAWLASLANPPAPAAPLAATAELAANSLVADPLEGTSDATTQGIASDKDVTTSPDDPSTSSKSSKAKDAADPSKSLSTDATTNPDETGTPADGAELSDVAKSDAVKDGAESNTTSTGPRVTGPDLGGSVIPVTGTTETDQTGTGTTQTDPTGTDPTGTGTTKTDPTGTGTTKTDPTGTGTAETGTTAESGQQTADSGAALSGSDTGGDTTH